MARSGSSSKGKLAFNQQLTGAPNHEILNRLKVKRAFLQLDVQSLFPDAAAHTCQQVLHEQLAALEQETIDTKSLDKVKSQLINGSLLLGKDKSVKAYTCCCLADLLRLYAPDCPYDDKQLKVGDLPDLRSISKVTRHAHILTMHPAPYRTSANSSFVN